MVDKNTCMTSLGIFSYVSNSFLCFPLLSSKQFGSEKELLLHRTQSLLLLDPAVTLSCSCFYDATVCYRENDCNVINSAFQLYSRIKEETMMRLFEGNGTSACVISWRDVERPKCTGRKNTDIWIEVLSFKPQNCLTRYP